MNESPPKFDPPPIRARQLSRTMGGHAVLCRVEMSISAGEIVAFVGANGVGKSTLMRCLVGQLRPSSGEVQWFGASPNRRPDRHRLVGFAAHESYLYSELTATENLLFAARMQAVSQPAQRVMEILDQFGLSARRDQAAGTMSKGLKQRLSLARAVVHDPPIVIFDEPFTGLDTAGREWLESWLADLRQRGRAIGFTSHDSRQCHRIADRVLELRSGTLHPIASQFESAAA